MPAEETKPEELDLILGGEFTFEPRLRSLRRGEEPVRLTPKPYATLAYLVRNRTKVVSKAELLENVWGEVRELNTVEHAVSQLRRVLGDDSGEGKFIRTIPGEGYLFTADVRPFEAGPAPSQSMKGLPAATR